LKDNDFGKKIGNVKKIFWVRNSQINILKN